MKKEYTGIELLLLYANNELGKYKSIKDTFNQRYCNFNENGVLKFEGITEVNTRCILNHTFEVEIIEEEKGIEKIIINSCGNIEKKLIDGKTIVLPTMKDELLHIAYKVNELIDEVNKSKGEKQ